MWRGLECVCTRRCTWWNVRIAIERRHEVIPTDLNRMGSIRDVENDRARIAIREVQTVAVLNGFVAERVLQRAVGLQVVIGRKGLAADLARDMELANTFGIRGVAVVEDVQN